MISVEEIDEIYRGILNIRSSIDLQLRISRLRYDPLFVESTKRVLLSLEGLRLDLNFARRAREEQPLEILLKTQDQLRDLLNDREFLTTVRGVRFRPPPPGRERITPDLNNPELSVVDAAAIILNRIDGILDQGSSRERAPGAVALRRVIPDQKLAPAMFDIVSGKIVVVKQPAKTTPEDEDNVARARDTLSARGKSIIDALEKSNCDRRIVEGMRELQVELERQDNIIELGLMNMALERVCKGAAAELPESLLGAIEGQTAGIGMYVAQFPAWQRFSENAASIDLDGSDIQRIGDATQAIIEKLAVHPDIAEEEVPRTLKALRALIANPAQATKRAAFAVLRTLENLVAKIYQYGADFLDKTATKTVDGLSAAASKTIIGSLLGLALIATANLGGVTGKVAETAWMKTAAEIVRKQIEDVAR